MNSKVTLAAIALAIVGYLLGVSLPALIVIAVIATFAEVAFFYGNDNAQNE